MLARACFGNQPGFAHFFGQQGLSQHVVDFMRAGMIEIFPFKIYFCASQGPSEPLGVIKRTGPPGIFVEQALKFCLKLRVVFIIIIGLL